MQYLGGKSRIAKQLAPVINEVRAGRYLWEPFCGGLGITAALGGEGCASDAHVPLIALYRGWRAGWVPPAQVGPADYASARELPDDDPMKAFVGFGCSYGGKYFGGLARDPKSNRNYAANCASSLRRTLGACGGFAIEQCDFLAVEPGPIDAMIYCDPPYLGTTGYGFEFDYPRFVQRLREWSAYTDVCVSEYTLKIGSCIFELSRNLEIGGNNPGTRGKRTERLFFIPKGSI